MTQQGGTFNQAEIFDSTSGGNYNNDGTVNTIVSSTNPSPEVDIIAGKISRSLRKTFLEMDDSLLRHCAEHQLHYSSSTGVVALLWGNLLTVAHVGDSKACIARLTGDTVQPEWLTVDHKPNMPQELARIERAGGSLARLHGNKPYIRGGDFHARQAAGDHPKQLNYSRAFGGKDLKRYGLIADPDVSQFHINPDDKLVILASDGLWDVLNPKVACDIALRARAEGRSATTALVQWALQEMPNVGVRDNITCLAVFLNDTALATDSIATPLLVSNVGVSMPMSDRVNALTGAGTSPQAWPGTKVS